ncbi:MAG: ABC transporter substrate-binding protein [Deltaproteobacteria bacterium]|nr:ABC transporter substrate-binding protein [Deltaproteobacteria bacterium]
MGRGRGARLGGRVLVAAFLGAALIGSVVAAPVARPRADAADTAVVKVGTIGLVSDAGLYVAVEKGYFQEAGVRPQMQRIGSGAKMIPALATGEIEVAGGTASAGLFNSIVSGMDFKVVADKGQVRPGHEYTLLVVRKDLLDSGAFKDLPDLRGRKVALLPGQGVVTQYVLGKILEQAQLSWDTVDKVDIAAPNHVNLLANRQVDAAVTAEPFGAKAELGGVGKRYYVAGRIKALERLQVAVIMYSGKLIAERRELARRFMSAYVRGLRFVNQRGLKSDEVIAILTKHIRVSPDDIRVSTPVYLSPDGRPDVESLAAQQEWYHRMGMVKQKVPMDRAVDLSFLPQEGRP